MSLLESIDAFETDVVTVTRTAKGTYVSGVYVPATPSTFLCEVSIQPATGMQRVVGGSDMRSDEKNEYVYDVRQLFTRTELKVRTSTTDPDLLSYAGSMWTVFRVELWTYDDEVFYRCVITRRTDGAA